MLVVVVVLVVVAGIEREDEVEPFPSSLIGPTDCWLEIMSELWPRFALANVLELRA